MSKLAQQGQGCRTTRRRMVAAGAAASVLALAGGALGVTPAALAAPPSRTLAGAALVSSTPVVPTIAVDGVTLSRSSVAVSGCASLPVTVRMHVKRASGTYDETTTPAAVLSRVGAAPAHPERPRERLVHLKLASGTATDGIYEGVTQVHSTMNGAFKVSQVTTLSWEGAKQLPEAAVSGPVLTTAITKPFRITGS